MPPTAPAIPPKPTTDPTARRGNMSEVSVKRLADQPWCAAAAMETSAHRHPEAGGLGREHDGHHREGAHEHRGLARSVHAPALLDQGGRQPASPDAAHVGHEVDHDEGQPDGLQVEAVVAVEEIGDPEEVQPPDGVGHELADREGPGLAVGEELAPGDGRDPLGRVVADVGHLRGGEPGVLLGRTVAPRPPGEPEEAREAGGDERPLPAPVERDPGNDQRGDERPHVRARVEDAGGEGALLLREPLRHRLDGGREVARFAEAEEEPHEGEARGRSREHHDGQAGGGVEVYRGELQPRHLVRHRVAHRGHAPEHEGDAEPELRAQLVHDPPRERRGRSRRRAGR